MSATLRNARRKLTIISDSDEDENENEVCSKESDSVNVDIVCAFENSVVEPKKNCTGKELADVSREVKLESLKPKLELVSRRETRVLGSVPSSEEIVSFQRKVFRFYAAESRDLPWRKTKNPYFIWLSETMSQQTQIKRVVEYYKVWKKKWPTVQDLAQAPRAEVLSAWMGLGYNSRGVNIHRAAQIIVESYGGDVLAAMKDFKKIPGVGQYTSRAVQIFSTNADIATVDTNIRRIFLHEFNLNESSSDAMLGEVASLCLPVGQSRDWHNALMDYGALRITARRTRIKPKTIQSKFEGSDRQIRAKALREVLSRSGKGVSERELVMRLSVPASRLSEILSKLVRQKHLNKRGNLYFIFE